MIEKQVPRRRWGKTELSIPVIPFGTQGFGNNFGPVTDDEAADLIRFAVDIGSITSIVRGVMAIRFESSVLRLSRALSSAMRSLLVGAFAVTVPRSGGDMEMETRITQPSTRLPI